MNLFRSRALYSHSRVSFTSMESCYSVGLPNTLFRTDREKIRVYKRFSMSCTESIKSLYTKVPEHMGKSERERERNQNVCRSSNFLVSISRGNRSMKNVRCLCFKIKKTIDFIRKTFWEIPAYGEPVYTLYLFFLSSEEGKKSFLSNFISYLDQCNGN